ncbi:MAG: GNAT family N-acetyltransferase [Oscillospiraceae bacterium]|nr:GNAT family N-acetyltransferase [Oscillospiraceae bacterium]
MKTLETERLILRKFAADDFAAVHSYASCRENVLYMPWGPNSEEQTRDFINTSISKAEEIPINDYQYAIVLKKTGNLIGGCEISPSGEEASLGWTLHRDYWKQGYGPEMGKALLKFGFEELGLRRITANCDAENYGSYRVMEKIGMRREGLSIESRPANKLTDRRYSDTLRYAILKDEWDIQKEIAYYNSLPCVFDGFIDVPELSDGLIYLVCTSKGEGNPEKKWVPAYHFAVCKGGEKIGEIGLRIGYTDGLYYGGQIGYGIDEKYRGNGYAVRACRLLIPVVKAHGMTKLLITNNHINAASKRVCEKLGAKLVRVARLPEWHDLYKDGQRYENIFEWRVE